jgi:hypothetical protein
MSIGRASEGIESYLIVVWVGPGRDLAERKGGDSRLLRYRRILDLAGDYVARRK